MPNDLTNRLSIHQADLSKLDVLAKLLIEEENKFNTEQGREPVNDEYGRNIAKSYLSGTIYISQLTDNFIGYARVNKKHNEFEIINYFVSDNPLKFEIEVDMIRQLSELAKKEGFTRIFSVVNRNYEEKQNLFNSLKFESYQPTGKHADVFSLWFK